MTERRQARLALGRDAILSVAEAIELLPWRDSESRAWLEERDLILRRPDLPGPCVLWSDVLDALRQRVAAAPAPRPTGSLPRADLPKPGSHRRRRKDRAAKAT